MTGWIDDEAKPAAAGILVAWHQKAALIARSSVAADDRHDLGHTCVLIGEDRGSDDEVGRMALIERPAILGPAFALDQYAAVDHLPGIPPCIADGFSAKERSYPVNSSGKLITTIAHSQSSSYQGVSFRSRR